MSERMQGKFGFDDDIVGLFTSNDRACMRNIISLTSWPDVRPAAREILRRVRLVATDPDHMPMGRTWSQSEVDLFAGWVQDGTPKRRGAGYAAYFRNLDAVTEYFDVYAHPAADDLMPNVYQYFGGNDVPERRKALNIWRSYAVIADDDPAKAVEKQALDAELAHAEVADAVKKVDIVLLDLVRSHLGSAVDAMLDAFFRFGADRLPEDPDRLERIQRLNDPSDFRLTYALYHRMDSLIMWMNWMGHVECAVTLYGSQDQDHGLRTAMMAALCLGYSADCVFRNRGQTLPEYYRPDGEERMWRKSTLIANNFDKARTEAHLLARLRETKQSPAVVAMDVPVRFQQLA